MNGPMDNVRKEFSRNAKYYNEYNQIQKEVVKDLLAEIKHKPKRIIDIGSGRGELFSRIDWPLDSFTAVDFSEAMCRLHPRAENVRIIQGDFNRPETFRRLKVEPCDLICSASALQWAKELAFVFEQVAGFHRPVALALFTSNTFSRLHSALGVNSPLHTKETILNEAHRVFGPCRTFVKTYRLTFDSTKLMLNYIKRSGVSSGMKKLSVGELRQLIKDNHLKSIEAEVLFIISDADA